MGLNFYTNKKEYKLFYYSLLIAILCTILSQSSWSIDFKIAPYLQLSWIFPLILGFQFKSLYNIITPILLLSILFVYCIFMTAIFPDSDYISILSVQRIPLILMLLIIGNNASRKLSQSQLQKVLLIATSIGGFLLLISFYLKPGELSYSENSLQLGTRKNTLAILILTCIYIVYKLNTNKNRISQICIFIYFLSAIFLMISMKCRTAIFSIPLICVSEFILSKKKFKLSTIIKLILVSVGIISLFPNIFQYIFTDFIYDDINTKEMNSMNVRYSMIETFNKLFANNIFCGTGKLFIENFYLMNLLNLGIIGFTPLLLFLFWSYKVCFSLNNRPLFFLNKILFILYTFNGLLEGESPFGPGTRCFILWFIIGYSISYYGKTKKNNYENYNLA